MVGCLCRIDPLVTAFPLPFLARASSPLFLSPSFLSVEMHRDDEVALLNHMPASTVQSGLRDEERTLKQIKALYAQELERVELERALLEAQIAAIERSTQHGNGVAAAASSSSSSAAAAAVAAVTAGSVPAAQSSAAHADLLALLSQDDEAHHTNDEQRTTTAATAAGQPMTSQVAGAATAPAAAAVPSTPHLASAAAAAAATAAPHPLLGDDTHDGGQHDAFHGAFSDSPNLMAVLTANDQPEQMELE